MPIGPALDLHDHIDGPGHLALDGLEREPITTEHRKALQPMQRIDGAVGVHRRQTAPMTGVERMHEVEGFDAADLPQDQAVGTHPKRITDEVPHGDQPDVFDRCGTGFQPHNVTVTKSQLGSILDRDDSFRRRDTGGDGVEECGLAGTRAAAHHHIAATGYIVGEQGRSLGTEVVEGDIREHKPANRDIGPVKRDRGNDDVDATAIGQPAIDRWRTLIHAPTDGDDEPFDEEIDVGTFEPDLGCTDCSCPFHPYGARPVDHHLAHRRVSQEGIDCTQPGASSRHEPQDLVARRVRQEGFESPQDLGRVVGWMLKEMLLNLIDQL